MKEVFCFLAVCLVIWCLDKGPAVVAADLGDTYAVFAAHAASCGPAVKL